MRVCFLFKLQLQKHRNLKCQYERKKEQRKKKHKLKDYYEKKNEMQKLQKKTFGRQRED